MNKYLNIFHGDNRKECFVIHDKDSDKTRKLEIGETVMVFIDNNEKPVEAVLGFDVSKGEFFLQRYEEKYYQVQGILVE